MSGEQNNIQKEQTVPDAIGSHPAWHRLIDQLNWYDHKSQYCQRLYKRLKFAQITFAVFIPATSLLPSDYAKWTASILGIGIAVLEAVQQMNQYFLLWTTYRATAERLKHEKYLFLSSAGPYKGLPQFDGLILLAERVEEHVSTEHANWINETRRTVAFSKSKETQ